MTKEEILTAAEHAFNHLTQACAGVNERLFFDRPGHKWSIAENVQHLIISTNTTTLAYSLPKFLVKIIGGTPNRPSRSFDELSAKYHKKLEEGGQASGRYIPKPIEVKYGRQKLMANWEKAAAKFLDALERNRTEQDLDKYLVAHPLLGRITLRELGYFTIFHTAHHLETIDKRASFSLTRDKQA
jgi:hypothetical protein